MNADPEVMHFFAAPMTREESDAAAERYNLQLDRDGFTMFAAELRSTGQLAGVIGMQTMRDEIPYTPTPAIEIGWRLARAFHNQGLATEGATAIVDFAFHQLDLSELIAITAVGNTASRRVMQKLNMTHDPTHTFNHPRMPPGHPHQLHALYILPNPAPTRLSNP